MRSPEYPFGRYGDPDFDFEGWRAHLYSPESVTAINRAFVEMSDEEMAAGIEGLMRFLAADAGIELPAEPPDSISFYELRSGAAEEGLPVSGTPRGGISYLLRAGEEPSDG
jgi:hypothetical protein